MFSSRTWYSRRIRLAPTTDRRSPGGALPGAATRVATFLLLIAGGVVALLFAIRLTAAAFDRGFSPFPYLQLPTGHAARAWLLVVVVAVLATLVWLVLRHGERMLWLSCAAGGVLAPSADLEHLLEAAACRHPEVVRAQARLQIHRGTMTGTLRIFCRPLVDPAPVAAYVGSEARHELCAATAVTAELAVRPSVLTVRQLKRYLS